MDAVAQVRAENVSLDVLFTRPRRRTGTRSRVLNLVTYVCKTKKSSTASPIVIVNGNPARRQQAGRQQGPRLGVRDVAQLGRGEGAHRMRDPEPVTTCVGGHGTQKIAVVPLPVQQDHAPPRLGRARQPIDRQPAVAGSAHPRHRTHVVHCLVTVKKMLADAARRRRVGTLVEEPVEGRGFDPHRGRSQKGRVAQWIVRRFPTHRFCRTRP